MSLSPSFLEIRIHGYRSVKTLFGYILFLYISTIHVLKRNIFYILLFHILKRNICLINDSESDLIIISSRPTSNVAGQYSGDRDSGLEGFPL